MRGGGGSRDDALLLVTEDGALRRTAGAPWCSSSDDVYIGLRRRRELDTPFADDSRSRPRARACERDDGDGARLDVRGAGGDKSSRLECPRNRGEPSRLIASRGAGESVRLAAAAAAADPRGNGELSRW